MGFTVDISGDGEDGFERATKTPYDAIVIDIMLPKRDGLSVLKMLRMRKVTAPVMIITARALSRVASANASFIQAMFAALRMANSGAPK